VGSLKPQRKELAFSNSKLLVFAALLIRARRVLKTLFASLEEDFLKENLRKALKNRLERYS